MPSTKGLPGQREDGLALAKDSATGSGIAISEVERSREALPLQEEIAALRTALSQEHELRTAAELELANLRGMFAEQQAAAQDANRNLCLATSELQDLRVMLADKQRRLSEAEANARDAASEVLGLRQELLRWSTSPAQGATAVSATDAGGGDSTHAGDVSVSGRDVAADAIMGTSTGSATSSKNPATQQAMSQHEVKAKPVQHPLCSPLPVKQQQKYAPKPVHPLQSRASKQLPSQHVLHVTGLPEDPSTKEEPSTRQPSSSSATGCLPQNDLYPSASWGLDGQCGHRGHVDSTEQAQEMDDFTWRRHPATSERYADAAESDDKDGTDHYQVLGVSRHATADEIRQGYRRRALQWHPDKNPSDRQRAEQMFKRIAEAYAVLSDVSRRSCYDQNLASKEAGIEKTADWRENDLWAASSAYAIFERFFGSSDPFQHIWFPGDS